MPSAPAPLAIKTAPGGAERLELDLRSGAPWREPEGEPQTWDQAWRVCVGLCAGRARQAEPEREAARVKIEALARRWGADFAARPARVRLDGRGEGKVEEAGSALAALALMQKQAGRNALARSGGPHWGLSGPKAWRSGDFAPMWSALCEAGALREPKRIKGIRKIAEAMGEFASDKELFPFEARVAEELFADEERARVFFKEPAKAVGWALRGCLRQGADGGEGRAARLAALMERLSALWAERFAKEAEGMWADPARLIASWPTAWAPPSGSTMERRALWDALGRSVERARQARGPAKGSRACASVCQAITSLSEGQAAECCWLGSLESALRDGAGPSERDEYGRSPLMILAEASDGGGQSDAAEYEALLASAASLLLRAGAGPNDLLRETPEQLAQKIRCQAVRRAVLSSLERDALSQELKAGERGAAGRGRL